MVSASSRHAQTRYLAACAGTFFNPVASPVHALRSDFRAGPSPPLFLATLSICIATTAGFAATAWSIAAVRPFHDSPHLPARAIPPIEPLHENWGFGSVFETMEKIDSWRQDWSDACEYARECAPDLSFLAGVVPDASLLLTLVVAFAFWAANARQTERSVAVGAFNTAPDRSMLRQLLSPLTICDMATAGFVSAVSALSHVSGLEFLLFPELGALTNDIFRRPRGVWANAPLMLILTPFLAGLVGTLITRLLPYGTPSILLTVFAGVLIMRFLGSPITPAISAGLLPLTLGEANWWYSPSLLLGVGLLVGLTALRRRFFATAPERLAPVAPSHPDPGSCGASPLAFFSAFLLLMALGASLTGVRFLMFPPLAVIAFEMFAHASICPWAQRPLLLPVICGLAAIAGVTIVGWLGTGAGAVALTVIFGAFLLRAFALHAPPAIAVGLLPFVMPHPEYRYSIAVVTGTALLALSFLLWRRVDAGKRIAFGD